MKVRLTGVVGAQELPLTLDGTGTATLTAQIDLDGETTGIIEARLLNLTPARLVSNAVQIQVVDALVARTLTPALVQQDQTAPLVLEVKGFGFVPGATLSFGLAGGAAQVLTTTLTDPGTLQATAPAASTLPLGRYSVAVKNPGGTTSNALTLTVSEGQPNVTGIAGAAGNCVNGGQVLSGAVLGSYLYPLSVVHIRNAALGVDATVPPADTVCVAGTDALGQCKSGLGVTVDPRTVPYGTYSLTVTNPGPLESNPQTIVVKASCP